jgi:hypothetical protein
MSLRHSLQRARTVLALSTANARHVATLLVVIAVLVFTWSPLIDQPATERIEASLKRTLISFATARALNAAVSVVEGTQFSAQPLGFGVTLTPGQLLAPVNNLVKHFADLMLVATVVLAVERLLMGIGSFWVISLALSVIALAWGAANLRRIPTTRYRWLASTLVVLTMVRFAVPVVVLVCDLLWQQFLAPQYVVSQGVIESASGKAVQLGPSVSPSQDKGSVLDRMQSWVSKSTDIRARFEDLRLVAESAIDHVVRLMAIYFLQIVITPILMLWLMFAVLRSVFRPIPTRSDAPAGGESDGPKEGRWNVRPGL